MKYKIKRKKRSIKSWHILSILIVVLISISTSYALHSSRLVINGTAIGIQKEHDVIYLNISNSSSYPKTVKNMETYSCTFTSTPIIESIRMGAKILTLNTDYTFENETLTIPNVTGNIVIEGKLLSNYAAEIDGKYFTTLQKAIDDVPKDNSETTIKLLKNVSEKLSVVAKQNIVFDLQIYTVSNNGNNAVIDNKGTIKISNGTITSNATNNAVINNQSSGNIIISGGSIIATGDRQALYNNGGTAEITGNAYLSSKTNLRAAVQNLANGKLKITGGTIVSTSVQAVENVANLTIGTKDGIINIDSPVIQGETYGVNSSKNFNFYDGIIKGKTGAVNERANIDDTEIEYAAVYLEETKDEITYQIAYLDNAQYYTIIFDPNNGIVDEENTKRMLENRRLGSLPIPTKEGYGFDGWYTLSSEGEKITRDTLVTADVTYYAHWSENIIAEIGDKKFATLQEAVDAVPLNNTQTNIKILKNITESITVLAKQNVEFDLQDYTWKNRGSSAVIENRGIITISNGNILSNADKNSAINNNANAKLIITGGSLKSVSERQTIYNNGGTVEISGNAYISSKASGVVTSGHSELERSTIQNLANGTLTITGGTIVAEVQQAIANEGTLTIGKKDGNIAQTPVIIGKTQGINNQSIFEFYDGVVKGQLETILGEITEQETDSQIISGTEEVNGETYLTAHLVLTE